MEKISEGENETVLTIDRQRKKKSKNLKKLIIIRKNNITNIVGPIFVNFSLKKTFKLTLISAIRLIMV